MFQFIRDNCPFLTAGVLLNFASGFGQTYFISTFAGSIQSDFSFSHGEWSGIYAIATAASAIVMVWAGTLTDRFRVRTLGPLSLLGLAMAAFSMVFVQNWVALVVVLFALRLLGQGMLSHVAIVAMARWYVASRGKALSIAGLGYSAGEAFLPLTIVAFLGVTDWRNLWIAAAVVCLALVPVVWHLLRLERTPQSEADRSEAVGMENRHWSRRHALSHPLIWILVPVISGPSAFLTALFFQQVHLAEVKGWSHSSLVAIFPAYTFVALCAMLLTGWALDKYGTDRLVPFAQLPISAGFFVIWWADTILSGAVGFVLIGVGFGVYATLLNAFWAEFYGTRFLGSIKSLAAAIMVLGAAIGPAITGLAIDRGIDLPSQMPAIGFYFIFTSGLVWLGVTLWRPSLPRAA